MGNRWFAFSIAGFTLGVFIRSLVSISGSFALLVLTLGGALVLLSFLSARSRATLFLIGLFLGTFAIGTLRFDLKDAHREDPLVAAQLDVSVSASGVIVEEPAEKDTSQQLTVLLDMLGGASVREKVLVSADRFPSFSYGDRVSIEGSLSRPEPFSTESGRMFDYPAYLAKDDIYYQIRFAHVALLASGGGNPLLRTLFSLKHAFLARIAAVIPEPESSLAGGLLLGGKQSLGERLSQEFRTAGIVHIVVLSGYNITVVADAVMKVFAFLPRAFGFSMGALSIVLFALMTGASATVVRASVMALLVVFARATGHTYQIAQALLLAAFFMLIQNPKILVFDPSFQLSFLATIGLIFVSPLLEKYFQCLPTRFGFREVVLSTCATQLTVLPLLLYQTGNLSVVALPVNLLVLPLIPLSMFLAFIAGIAGFLGSIIALPFAFLAYLPLLYIIRTAHFASSLPFAAVSVPQISGAALLLCYALFAIAVFFLFQKKNSAASV